MAHIIGYNVYYAPDGCAPEFLGFCEDDESARDLADTGARGLEKSLWETARKAGHCGGMRAPDTTSEDQSGECVDWAGPKMQHCMVPVFGPA